MGCDIHLFVEVQTDAWRHADRPARPCVPCRGTGMGPSMEPGSCDFCDGDGSRRGEFYDHRNYAAFSVLANVRNRDDEHAIKPIAMPRGLPWDIDPETRGLIDSTPAEHNFGWLLLSEVLSYPHWDASTRYRDHASTVREECGGLLEAMKQFVAPLHPDPARIRIVFGFDS